MKQTKLLHLRNPIRGIAPESGLSIHQENIEIRSGVRQMGFWYLSPTSIWSRHKQSEKALNYRKKLSNVRHVIDY